jgi:hypothetical protein
MNEFFKDMPLDVRRLIALCGMFFMAFTITAVGLSCAVMYRSYCQEKMAFENGYEQVVEDHSGRIFRDVRTVWKKKEQKR